MHRYLPAIPIPVFIVLIAVLTPFDNQAVSVPPLLLPILNTIFISAIYFTVAYISAKSYLARGSQGILLFGCGMLVFGSAALLGGWLVGAPDGININVILVNIGALFGSIFHLMGALLTSIGVNQELDSKRRKQNLTLAYPGVLIFIILLTIASLQSIIPPFFIQGTGFTLLREVVLGTATLLFAISALLFIRLYSRLKEIYLYWYSLALILVTMGLFATLLVHTSGSLLSWMAARLPLYVGGIYFLNAIFIARRTSRIRGTSIEETVANFFREPEANFRALIETTNDAIVSFNTQGRVILWNPAAEKIFGYGRDEAIGSLLSNLIFTDRYADNLREDMENLTLPEKSGLTKRTIEMEAKRKDGSVFPIEFSISARNGTDEWIFTSIIRDITERKRIEQALKKSEASLVEAQRLARIGSWQWDIKTDEVRWSDEMYTLFGVDKKSFVPNITSFTGFIHADDQPSVAGIMKQLTSEGGSGSIDFRIVLSDGSIRFLHAEGEIVAFDESGKPSLMIGIDQDITERKQAEEALRKAHDELELRVQERTAELEETNKALQAEIEERKRVEKKIEHLASFPQLNPIPIMEIDINGTVTFTNAATAEVLKTLDIRDDARIFLPGDFEEIMKAFEQEKEIKPFYREVEVKDRIFAESIYVSKKLNVVRIYAYDITERKLAEEKIREQATLLDKAQDAIIVRDLEHRVTYWNKSAVSIYGFPAEEAIGKNADELLYKEESPQLTEARKSMVKEGEWMGELRQRTKEGGDIIVESRWTLVRDDEGKPKSILIINTDITEKKTFESQLMRAQRMESIGTLAGGIAHDLNNMLTPMMMSLHMLKEKFKDEQSQKLLTILEKNSQRSADLIKQVLSFSRGVEGERNPLQARHLITEIEKVAKETFPRNIEIRIDVPKDLFTISGDATQLHQVIMNLCVNARDAMPDGGILNISAENFFIDENYAQMNTDAKIGSYVVIAVSDTGIGIPPKILDRIFEPFFTTKGFGKGTGLGLSTALAIVKSHGGFINVYSEVGKGTTFTAYLPATLAEMQNVEEQQLELLTGHGEFILIAEDEDSIREVTVSTLKGHGYNVLAANDGADAVALYAQNKDKIKAILMDMMMPVMDGETSIRAIRIINPGVKVIVVSGLAEKDKLAKIKSTNAHALLPKPYTAERLLKTIYEVLSAK